MSRSPEEVDEILEELELQPGARILDVGCGPGRILLPLARRGFRVVGIDVCDQYRREARAQARRLEVEVDVRAGRIYDFAAQPDESFDAVLMIFAVIGYHADPAWDALAARRCLELVRPGGQIMVQTRRPAATSGTLKHAAPTGVCIERRSFDRPSKTLTTTWTIAGTRQRRVHTSRVRVYDKSDLVGLLEFAGFEEIRAWESAADERIVLVGTRPIPEPPAS